MMTPGQPSFVSLAGTRRPSRRSWPVVGATRWASHSSDLAAMVATSKPESETQPRRIDVAALNIW